MYNYHRALLILLVLPLAIASVSSTPIGYEYIGNINNATHVWNNGSMAQDYYFYSESTLQISNNLSERWEEVHYGLTYGNNLTQLMDNYLEFSDPINVNRKDKTDNLTYVNITVWKDKNISGRAVRLAKLNHIKVNEDYMHQDFFMKSYKNLNKNIYLTMKRTNISISGDEANDYMRLYYKDNSTKEVEIHTNNTRYYNGSNLKPYIFLHDNVTEKYIMFYHEHEYDWYIVKKNGNIYLLFNWGNFSKNEVKSVKTQWVDPVLCGCTPDFVFGNVYCTPSALNITIDAEMLIQTKWLSISGDCSVPAIRFQNDHNLSESYTLLTSNSLGLKCSGVSCLQRRAFKGVWYYFHLKGENVFRHHLRTKWICGASNHVSATPVIRVKSCNYSESGNWDIDEETVCYGDKFTITGNTTIHTTGNLTLLDNASMTVVDEIILKLGSWFRIVGSWFESQ